MNLESAADGRWDACREALMGRFSGAGGEILSDLLFCSCAGIKVVQSEPLTAGNCFIKVVNSLYWSRQNVNMLGFLSILD